MANKDALKNLKGQGFHTNPERRGRKPKGAVSLSTMLKKLLEARIPVVINGKKFQKTYKEVLVMKLIQAGHSGDIRAIDMIFDRVDGKITQPIGGDLTVIWREEKTYETNDQANKSH